jgi:serine/threonine-protein kinase
MGSPEESVPQDDDAPREAEAGAAGNHSTATEPRPGEPIWARIRRHKVVEWTLAYVAFGYALLHGVQMLRETFDWPFLVPRLTVFGLVLGAPIAVTLAWYHGHRARHRVSGQELAILIALLVAAGSVLWWVSRNTHERATAAVTSTASSAAAFNPPAHSIAVLPFVNMSGDASQAYFSDGLTEELLNSLSRINELQVAARTSSFSFEGQHPDIAAVAHKLNVAAVLEGSVRRSARTVRITAQLVNGTTGYHLWSQTYDRDLGDILQLQTEIATAVAGALKVTLLGDAAARIESGGTHDPAALDAYLRAKDRSFHQTGPHDVLLASEEYAEAIRADPNYALAFANRSLAFTSHSGWITGRAMLEERDQAQADAHRAIALAPELPEGRLALAYLFQNSLEFAPAAREYEHALALGSGNARVLRDYGLFAVFMSRADAGIAALRRAAVLDPLSPWVRIDLGSALWYSRRYDEALRAFQEALTLDPESTWGHAWRGFAYYELGDLQSARSSCGAKPDFVGSQLCLWVVYEKLGRHADSQAVLAKVQKENGDAQAYLYAAMYALLGNTDKALQWLETAYRVRDSGLQSLKVDPAFDALRNEPRFQAIERELKFPN